MPLCFGSLSLWKAPGPTHLHPSSNADRCWQVWGSSRSSLWYACLPYEHEGAASSLLYVTAALGGRKEARPHWFDARARRQGEVQCEHPNASLYAFVGNLLLRPPLVREAVTLPLSPASLLLRGSVLRNTRTVTGAVIFAGHETKARCAARHQM